MKTAQDRLSQTFISSGYVNKNGCDSSRN